VGITRAKDQLYLISAMTRRQSGMVVYNKASRFLKEIPEDLIIGNAVRKPMNVMQPVNPQSAVHSPHMNIKTPAVMPKPKTEPPEYAAGDFVKQARYGVGEVLSIAPAGADYEVTVSFASSGVKKFMAHLSKLEKVEL
jgi:DNA helicase-2/ATP-dependent DNA helicase PcrA